jgi:hypothetical protein
MDSSRTGHNIGALRQHYAQAEQYVQKILPAQPQEETHGALLYVSVATEISYTEGSMKGIADCLVFDAALSAVIRAEFPKLASKALARMERTASEAERAA